jgi:adenylate cyclase
VLQGSVRRSGNRVRCNAHLTDAAADAHLWAERFESDRGDPFAVEDEITSRIAYTLGVELVAAEVARPASRYLASWSLRRAADSGRYPSELCGRT